jgi:hypothetical protein
LLNLSKKYDDSTLNNEVMTKMVDGLSVTERNRRKRNKRVAVGGDQLGYIKTTSLSETLKQEVKIFKCYYTFPSFVIDVCTYISVFPFPSILLVFLFLYCVFHVFALNALSLYSLYSVTPHPIIKIDQR